MTEGAGDPRVCFSSTSARVAALLDVTLVDARESEVCRASSWENGCTAAGTDDGDGV